MAALLKKRALAEYSQVIQEEETKPKKLKLVQKPPEPDIQLELQGLSSAEVLQVLLQLESTLPPDGQTLGTVLRELLDQYGREKEAVVRGNIARILGKLSSLPGINAENLLDDVLPLLKDEESNKAKCQLISALKEIGQACPGLKEVHDKLIEAAIKELTSSSHIVRSSSLQLIGALESLAVGRNEKPKISTEVHQLLENFMNDQDPRVRSSALEAMLQFHERELPLDAGIYGQCCAALSDDYEGVRLAAVQLIWILAQLHPDSLIPVSTSDEELRLVDDGFVKICNMMNDISVKVRTKAAALLGSMTQVSAKFLEQTLDKKLMSNMRRKKTAAERARDNFETGVWSTGQKWADDAPKEELDPESINLMNIGACGAFVHGLEDEYAEVRNTTLDSLCQLASQSEGFARLCQDSITDMFNDEIESVRLNAIDSLKKLSRFLELREDQLDIMLGVLQDFSYKSRMALRDMLCEMKLATKECLNACVAALLDNLRRYPEDRTSIWKCMQFLGKTHPSLALPLIPEFLCLHPYFDTPEPEMDDPAYISVLVLVFNAAAGNQTALSMFQEYTWRHYLYLRDTIPEMIPHLHSSSRDGLVSSKARSASPPPRGSAADFLQRTLSQLDCIGTLDNLTTQQLLQATVSDLERLAELDHVNSASAECTCLFLQSQLLITQLMSQHMHVVTGSVTVDSLQVIVEKIMSITNKLQTLYQGLCNDSLSLIRQTELKALTFRLGSTLATSSELATQMKAKEAFSSYLQKLQTFVTDNDCKVDACTAYLLSELSSIKNSQLSAIQKTLREATRLIKPAVCPLIDDVQKARVTILQPSHVSDNPIKFTSGLTAAVLLDAEIENVENVDNIRIQLKYPDTSVHLIIPSCNDLKKTSDGQHRLTATVLLSHGQWSESCHVEVGVVVLSSAVQSKFKSLLPVADIEQNVIELCEPVQVLVAPKPVKK